MDESERKAVRASILKSIKDTGCGELTAVEMALVGVLSTFMEEHIVLHRRLVALEKRVGGRR